MPPSTIYNYINHQEVTKRVANEIRGHRTTGSGKKLRFRHGSTNTTSAIRNKEDDNYHFIDISSLNHVIEINPGKGYVLVEPNVPMDALVRATLPYGLLPPLVMEFPGITVAGGIQGAALESSSFKWGQFNDTALEYEVITGDGEIITATPHTRQDLFYGLSGSYGSFGLLTLIKLKLIPAKKYIRLTYHRTGGGKDHLQRLKKEVKNPDNGFVEGLIFGQQNSVVITGRFSDEPDVPLQTFTKASDPWFWWHARMVSRKYQQYQERVPVFDYLFRYDRGAFWMGEYAFKRLCLPPNKITSFILNPLMNTRRLYEALHAAQLSQSYFIQDVYFPFERAIDCLDYNEKKLEIYPVWLCPVKPTQTSQKLSPHYSTAPLIIDVGFWGEPKNIRRNYFEINRDFEKFLTEHGARKMLYAETFFTEEEFWKIYDKSWYTQLRRQYQADAVFPDIWQKVHVAKLYEERMLKGVFKFIINLVWRKT